jgi:hypothetical protein
MNLSSQLRVEHGYRIGHSHQDESAPSDCMYAQIVILRLESDYVAADPRRQPAEQGGREGRKNRPCLSFRESPRMAGYLSVNGRGRGDRRRVNDEQLNDRDRLSWLALKISVAVMLAQPSLAAIPAPAEQTADERAVLAVDAQQRLAVASMDVEAIGRISDSHLRVNAPNNRILTREDLMRMVKSGEIRNEIFERTPEDVVITGDVGVVMGHEVVFPGAASEQARMYGRKTLNRRYTNAVRQGLHHAKRTLIPERTLVIRKLPIV